MSNPTQQPVGAAAEPASFRADASDDKVVAAADSLAGLGSTADDCEWLFAHFDADKDGLLNRVEYKAFLKSIDVWGRSDAYTDVFWAWTWRRICEQQAAPAGGLDRASFARRYAGPGRCAMLATDVERVRSASAAARERRPSETMLEVNCAAGHVMPLVPWSAGTHNPVGYSGGWLCDDCGRSCTDLGSDSSFATSRFFCASCKSDYCRDCGSKKAAEAAKSRNATERPINHLPKVCPAGHKLVFSASGRDTGWRCDGASYERGCLSGITDFGMTSGMPNWRCNECDFDLCDKCGSHYTPDQIRIV